MEELTKGNDAVIDNIEFLERTKNGEYAPIDKNAEEYGRIEVETISPEEVYIYNISA